MDMKKIIACAALVMGVVIFNGRLNAAVESDIVGYTTITTVPGFNMLGCVFNGLDGNALPLNQIVSGDFQDNDAIQVYDATTGYTSYTYWKDYGGWLDGDFNPATTLIQPGTAFWLNTPGRSITVTLKGAVRSGSYTYVAKKGLQMVSSALPVDMDLNNITWTGLTDGDEIQVRENGAYISYSYWKDYGGWLDGNFVPVTKPIEKGTSAWLKVAADGATFTIPEIN